jgi:polyisoprenyl-phosphate glycosyltransferase
MISFLVPAYNEADSILATLERLSKTLANADYPYEIIVIDDGSRDQTAERAATAGVRVIRHAMNKGYGSALKTGIYNAQYDWCAIVDADGTYPIEEFPKLLALVPDFDMVVGARTGERYWGSFSKRIGRVILLQLIAFVIGTNIPDPNSGMRVFRKRIALEHIRRISSGFSFTVTITLAMFLEGHSVRYVPIEYHERVGKSKVRIRIDSLRVVQILAQAIIYYNPLKLFLLLCFLCLICGGVFGLLLWLTASLSTGLMAFYLSLLTAILIGALGFLAEAIRLHRLAVTTPAIPTTPTKTE